MKRTSLHIFSHLITCLTPSAKPFLASRDRCLQLPMLVHGSPQHHALTSPGGQVFPAMVVHHRLGLGCKVACSKPCCSFGISCMHRSKGRQCHHPNLVHLHQIQAESFETLVLLTHGSHLGKIKAVLFQQVFLKVQWWNL